MGKLNIERMNKKIEALKREIGDLEGERERTCRVVGDALAKEFDPVNEPICLTIAKMRLEIYGHDVTYATFHHIIENDGRFQRIERGFPQEPAFTLKAAE